MELYREYKYEMISELENKKLVIYGSSRGGTEPT